MMMAPLKRRHFFGSHMSDMQEELRIATKAARLAGQAILSVKNKGPVRFKEKDEGPVTEADFAADKIIDQELRKAFPNDLIISEESADLSLTVPTKGRVWLVDPMDGTSDFVLGGDDFSVMIGLLIDGVPSLG